MTDRNDILEMAQGHLGRVLAIRLRPGTDVLKGLEEACHRSGINSGVILSAIGSLDGVAYCNPVELPEKKAGYGYGEVLHLTGPIELTNGSGIICHDAEGPYGTERPLRQCPRRSPGGGHEGSADRRRNYCRNRGDGHGTSVR